MRKSRQEAAETRQRIVKAASAEFRRHGISGTGLADLMATAGLTHGGFYKHFESKEQVVEEAIAVGVESMIEAWRRTIALAPKKPGVESAIADYLSADHCASVAEGCLFAALASEIARSGDSIRETTTKGFLEMVGVIAEEFPEMTPAAARKEAIWILCSMIGAVTMARVVADPTLSTSILREARKHLVKQLFCGSKDCSAMESSSRR